MTTEPHKRSWFQFRLRTLLILVTFVSVGLGWLVNERQRIRARNEWLKQHITSIEYGNWPPYQPAWLRTLLGDDSLGIVKGLTIGDDGSDVDLVHPSGLTQLQWLGLSNTHVTDAGLEHLSGLTQLQRLDLHSTQVTDAGVAHLSGLKQLQMLWIYDTSVTDDGLVHLAGLIQLQTLDLSDTAVTEAGRQKLRLSLPMARIYPDP